MTAITSAAMAMVRVFTGVLSSVGSLPQCPHIMPKIGRATPVHRVTAPSHEYPLIQRRTRDMLGVRLQWGGQKPK